MSSDPNETLGIYDLLAWFELNKKAIAVGVAAAALVGFGVYAYLFFSNQREIRASDALLALKPSGAADAVDDPAAYTKVAQEYSGTGAAERALLLAAGALFDQGKFGEAQQQFQKFLKDHPGSSLAPTAAYGVASCMEAQGQMDSALAGYQNVTVQYPNSAVVNDARLGMARIYRAKRQPEQALRIYDDLTRPGSFTAASGQVVVLRKQLLAEHPELEVKPATTNRVPAVTMTSTNANRTMVLTTNAAARSNGSAVKGTNRATSGRP